MADFHTSPSPSPPPFYHCDYSDWSPSFSIIPSVYLLAFLVGCLGNGLVLWAYLDRADGRAVKPGRLWICCKRQQTLNSIERSNHASFPDKTKENGGHSYGKSCRPSSSTSSSSYPPYIPRPSRSLTDSLIASLALADLCFLVTLPLWAVYTALGYHWPFGQPLCQISSFLTALNMYASVFSLSMLSVERYWVLTGRRPSSHYQPQQSCPRRALWILGGMWVLSGVLALPGLLLRSVQEVELESEYDWQLDEIHPNDSGSFFLSCQMDYSMLIRAGLEDSDRERVEMMWAAALSLKSTVIGFLLPLVILLVCYCSLAQLLSRHFGRGPLPDRRRQRRLLRVIITLVMAFFLCWLPLHVNKTVSLLLEFGFVPYSCSLDQILLAAQPYVTCLAYLNSCLNPLLYAACDPSFRKRCRGALCLLCGREKQGREVKKEEGEAGKEERSSAFPTGTQEETARTEGDEEERAGLAEASALVT